jgi:uncharacterized protein YciI
MKKQVLSILSLFVVFAFSQDAANKNDFEYFIVLYTLGENWDALKQTHEQPYFKEHSANLSALRKDKRISIGGRYGKTGMIILKAKDETEATHLISRDPAVENKIFNAEISQLSLFYKGCIE